jgi:hypothetical protein
MKTEILYPHDSRKSYYEKAHLLVDDKNHITYLKSYETKVAHHHHITGKTKVYGWYSATTARHINSFLHLFGEETSTKKEMENWER